MPGSGLSIKDLSMGMNLRDPALDIAAGETGESVGCDFSIPGVVRPMRESLLCPDWLFSTDIIDAHIVYLGATQYLFTTHSDGLRVAYNNTTYLINASFTGLFKVIAINGQYAFLANATLNIKWMPSYGTATYSMGLNTPGTTPTLASGGAGSLTGTYYVAVAYQNALGNYGAYTPYSALLTLSSEKLTINSLTPDTDGQTVKRRLAILGGSFTVPMVAYLENNTANTITLDDTDLAVMVDEELQFNNNKPPVGIESMVAWVGRIFFVIGDNNLYFSNTLNYEAFPATNYRSMMADEKLHQVAVDGQKIASRGEGGEYFTQLSTILITYWQDIQGAPIGAVSSRLLIKDVTGADVYASQVGLYATGIGPYLPKINTAIVNAQQTAGDPALIFGDHIADRAYLYFEDVDGVDRVMRIDYRLGRAVAHYVANIKPAAIFADAFQEKVFYALGPDIYEFDAGAGPMDTKLVIPENLMGDSGDKDFVSITYELETSPLSFQVSVDREIKTPVYTLPVAVRESDPVSLPSHIGRQFGMILTSTGIEYEIYLPWKIQAVLVSG